MRRRNQAILVDPIQAAKVRLAIRWGLHPDDIGTWRVMKSIVSITEGEEVVMWQE